MIRLERVVLHVFALRAMPIATEAEENERRIQCQALYIEAYKKKKKNCCVMTVVFGDDAGRLVFAIEDASIIVIRCVDAHAFNKFPLFAYSILTI